MRLTARSDSAIANAGPGWAGLAGLLLAAALAAFVLDTARLTALDWQPSLALAQPWRAFTAAAVHYSALHLAANVAGSVLVAAFGVAARVPAGCVWAWALAWPLTHVGLLLRPELSHYGGLSGVLHAGVAVVAVHLVCDEKGGRARRWTGAAVAAGLVVKVLSESPWGATLRRPEGWDIAVAPLAHATGTLAGAGCGLIAEWLRPRPVRAMPG